MKIDGELLARITGAPENHIMDAIVAGLDAFPAAQLDVPHRLAHYVAQIGHESAGFRYDEEIWGPTAAQKRYEGRSGLGNTQPGDGYLFRGRTPMQITGRANAAAFRDWCRANVSHKCPDFEMHPERMLDNPWNGLGPIWFWHTHQLNTPADHNDLRAITRIINGGYNGLSDRYRWYDRAALVLLGYAPDGHGIREFQQTAPMMGLKLKVDGLSGPNTRAALHKALHDMSRWAVVKPAPKAYTQHDKPQQGTRLSRVAAFFGIGRR